MFARPLNIKKIQIIAIFLISAVYSAGCQNTTIAKLGEILNGSGDTVVSLVQAPSKPVLRPIDDTGLPGDAVTNLNTGLVFTGTATDGNTVELLVDGTASGMTGAVAGGNWSITHTTALSAGSHNITARATDANGKTSAASQALTLVIDQASPAISSGSVAANNASVTVNFSEGMYTSTIGGALTSADFSLTFAQNAGTATNAVISGITHTAGSSSAIVNLSITGTPNGAETVEIKNANAIYDVAANSMPALSQTTGVKFLVNQLSPNVALTYNQGGKTASPFKAGVITITATYTQQVTSVPNISLTQQGSAAITSVAMSGTAPGNVFTFNYTVNTATGSTYIDGLAAVSLSTVQNATGYNSSAATNNTFTIDTTAPANQNAVFTGSVITTGNSIVPIVPTGTASDQIWFAPAGTTVFTAGSTMTTVSGTTGSIAAPATAGTYVLYVIDAAGNISVASTSVLTVDNTAPTLSPVHIASNNATATLAKIGNTVTVTFTSSENISTPSVSIAGNVASVTGGPTAWSASYTMAAGDANGLVPFTITFADLAGNAGTMVSAVTDASSVTFDKTAPVVSIGAPSVATVNNAAGVTYGITYSGANAINLTTGKISLNTTGGASCALSVTNGTTANPTVTLSSCTGNGTVGITLASASTDAAGNADAGAGPSATFTVDNIAPTVSIGVPSASIVNNLTNVTYGITYSGTNTVNLTAGQITLNTTGGASCNVSVTNGTTANPTVTLSSCTGNGTVGITLASASTDAAGNADVGAGPGATFTVDNIAPTVSIGAPSASTVNSATNVTYGITYSGANTVNLTAGQISLNTTGGATCNVSVTNGATANPTVTLSSCSGNGTVGITLASASTDAAGNADIGAGPSATFTVDNVQPAITSAETMDLDGNGKIDHYKITLSRNVNDSTFPGYSANALGSVTTAWFVGIYTNVQLSHGSAEPLLGDVANDNIIYVKFAEGAATDTGVKPDITTSAAPGLQDSIGNTIAQVITTSVAEADRARPVVMSATGSGNTTVYVTFSEPISAASGEVASNYSIPGLTVTGAVMSNDGVTQTPTVDNKFVILTTTAQTVGTNNYTVTAGISVTDPSNNAISGLAGNSAVFSGQPTVFKVLSASATNNTTVTVTFNNNIGTGGTTAANYTIAGLTVTNATVLNNVATLTTSSQSSNTLNGYTVVVAAVQDVYAQTVSANPNDRATFTGDTLPHVVSAVSIDMNHVNVTFSESVQWDSSANGALLDTNYTLNNGLTVNAGGAASFTPTTVVQLTTSNQASGTLYTLTVNANVKDAQGNLIDTAGRTATFTGLENIKVTSGSEVTPNGTTTYRIMTVTFSKTFMTGTANINAVDKTNAGYVHGSGASALQNWSTPAGTAIIGVCTNANDTACPATGFSGGNTIYLMVDDGAATPAKPAAGSYTFVAAGWSGSALTVTGAAGCILPTGGSSTTDCLQNNPNDRAAVVFGSIPTNPGQGPVFSDPFNDGVTKAGQAFVYNGKLHIGPNATYTGVFETNINMTNSTTITLDADSVTVGNQPFQGNATTYLPPSLGVWESCSTGVWPSCTAGNYLAGIDRMFSYCYKAAAPNIDTSLTGAACTTAGGTEYLFTLGFVSSAPVNGYQSNWNTTSTTSPFVFSHITGLSNFQLRTFRAMSFTVFKGWLYQASQHQNGTAAVRWNRFLPNGTSITDMGGKWLKRIGGSGSIFNGQQNVTGGQRLISIDSMVEYDNDGAGINESQLYIANGGSCNNGATACNLATRTNATGPSDGGILRSNTAVNGVLTGTEASTFASPPAICANAAGCDALWNDVTPNNTNWLKFMSIALPQDAEAPGGTWATDDWTFLQPANTITPAIKAIPYMVGFNGDLYIIRNACSSAVVQTLSATVHHTCATGSQVPQLWVLPAGTTATPSGAANWVLVGNVISGKTTMAGATWSDTANQPAYTGNNTHITLLAKNGSRLFIGFDNAVNGSNIWRSKAGVTNPRSEADFEAICDTGYACSVAAKQFGFGTIGDGNATNDITRFFDSVSVNDAGTDYLVVNAGDGVNPVKVYRASNN